MQFLALLSATAMIVRAAPFNVHGNVPIPIYLYVGEGEVEFMENLVWDGTDQACGSLTPPQSSEGAAYYGDNGFSFLCRRQSGNLAVSGPYLMFCPRDDIEYWYRRNLYIVPDNIVKGECLQRSRTEYGGSPSGSTSAHRSAPATRQGNVPATRQGAAPASYQGIPNTAAPIRGRMHDLASTEVSAGIPACVESPAMHSGNRALEAYLTSLDDTKRATAAYISFHEVYPQVQDMGTKYNVDHMDIAHPALGATYRVCAKAAPGHGNLRLHLVTSS